MGQEDVQCLGVDVELQYIAGGQQSPDILAEGGEQSFPTYKEMTKHIEDFSAAPPEDMPEEMPPAVSGGDIQDGGDAPAVANTAQSSNASRPANEACGALSVYMTVDLTDQNRSAPADESLATADILAKEYPGLEPNTSPACQSTYESFISASNNGNIGDALNPDRPSQSSQVAVHVYDTPMLVCKDTDLKDTPGSSSEAPTPIQIPGISREVTHAVDGSKGEHFPDPPPSIMSGDPQHSAEDSATAFRQSQPPDDPLPEYTYIQPRLDQSASTPDAVERRTQQSAHQDLQLQHGSVSLEYESLEMMLDQEFPHKVAHTRDGSEGERFPNPPPPVISDQPQHCADAPPTAYEQVQPSDVRQSQYISLQSGMGKSAATPGDAKNRTQPSAYQDLQLQHGSVSSEYESLEMMLDQEFPHKVAHIRDGSEGERFPNPPPPLILDQLQHIADAPPTVYEQVQPSDVRQSQYMSLQSGMGESAATPGDAKNQTQPSVYQELQLQHTPMTSEYQCLGASTDQ